ncbi:putative defense protein [Bacillus rossius redtenbacheri]|uniref:putative defense protein n=1 Tax=Bacillus rossius redtenbacheri TaxID=93214 RepID=UPI002FDE87FF
MKTFIVSVFGVVALAALCAAKPAESIWFAPEHARLDINAILAPICQSMIPTHGESVPQTSASPYKVTVAKTKVAAGAVLNVTVSGSDFKGIFIEARRNTTLVGTFEPRADNYTFIASCSPGKNNALFYENRAGVKELTVQWKAPETPETVVFRCTTVKSFSVFWVGDESAKVKVVKS